MRISHKFALTVAAILLVVITSMTILEIMASNRLIADSFGMTLREIARLGAGTISGEEHRVVNKKIKEGIGKAIADNPNYKDLQSKLRKMIKNSSIPYCIYTVIPDKHTPTSTTFAVNLYDEDDNISGNKFIVPPENSTIFLRCIRKKVAVSTKIYSDERGEWISAYAPILDKQGQVAAVLKIDFDIHTLLDKSRQESLHKLLLMAVVSFLSLLLALLIGHLLTRRIKHLQGEVRKVKEGDFSISFHEVRLKDEISYLEKEFQAMVSKLSERLQMIKFIPDFSLQKINDAKDGNIDMDGEKKEVIILFCDIRGFTKHSKSADPKDVVKLLNHTFSYEAEIIKKNGGSIDKYIGDEVMAVFAPSNSPEAAVKAAIEILQTPNAILDANHLGLGIGIHIGEVVMGAVGHRSRLDFTCIGAPVNLASRLCGQAKSGEIIISDDLYQLLKQKEVQVLGCKHEDIDIKGYNKPVSIYRTNISPGR